MRELQQAFLFDVWRRSSPRPPDDDLPEDLIIEPAPRPRS